MAAQLVEKVVYVDMEALEERAAELLAACGRANGPETRADQGVCVATRGSRYANSTRPKRATHDTAPADRS